MRAPLLVCVWLWPAFGCVRLHSAAFGCVRLRSGLALAQVAHFKRIAEVLYAGAKAEELEALVRDFGSRFASEHGDEGELSTDSCLEFLVRCDPPLSCRSPPLSRPVPPPRACRSLAPHFRARLCQRPCPPGAALGSRRPRG